MGYLTKFLLCFVVCFITNNSEAIGKNEPARVRVYGVDITPKAVVEVGSTDNLYYQELNPISSNYIILESTVLGHLSYQIFSTAFTFSNKTGRYESRKDDDFSDTEAKLKAEIQPNHRNQLRLDIQSSYGHDDRGLLRGTGENPFRSIKPDRYLINSVNGAYAYGSNGARGRVEMNVGSISKSYINNREFTRAFDFNQTVLGSAYYGRIGGRTYFVLDATANDFKYQLPSVSDRLTKGLTMGLTWGLTGKSTSYLKLGYQATNISDSSRNQIQNFYWDVNLNWSPKTYSEFSLSTKRGQNESNGDASYIDTKGIKGDWSFKWNSRFETKVSADIRDYIYIGDESNRKDRRYGMSLTAQYNMRRWLHFGARTSANSNKSNLNTNNFEKNDFNLYISASL